MANLLPSGNTRLASSPVTIYDGQILTLTITNDDPFPINFRSVLVERKNPENQFRPFSLGGEKFQLNENSQTVNIPLPGTYRVLRQGLDTYDRTINVGVNYFITFDAADPDQPLSLVRSGKDENDIFVTITSYRIDETTAKVSILSGGTSPEYTTRTVTHYDTDGTTVLSTDTYALSYEDGILVSEIYQ